MREFCAMRSSGSMIARGSGSTSAWATRSVGRRSARAAVFRVRAERRSTTQTTAAGIVDDARGRGGWAVAIAGLTSVMPRLVEAAHAEGLEAYGSSAAQSPVVEAAARPELTQASFLPLFLLVAGRVLYSAYGQRVRTIRKRKYGEDDARTGFKYKDPSYNAIARWGADSKAKRLSPTEESGLQRWAKAQILERKEVALARQVVRGTLTAEAAQQELEAYRATLESRARRDPSRAKGAAATAAMATAGAATADPSTALAEAKAARLATNPKDLDGLARWGLERRLAREAKRADDADAPPNRAIAAWGAKRKAKRLERKGAKSKGVIEGAMGEGAEETVAEDVVVVASNGASVESNGASPPSDDEGCCGNCEGDVTKEVSEEKEKNAAVEEARNWVAKALNKKD